MKQWAVLIVAAGDDNLKHLEVFLNSRPSILLVLNYVLLHQACEI